MLDLSPEEQKEVFFLEGTIHKLFSLMRKSICKCPVCMHMDRDMVFIPLHEMWFCTECQDEDRIWYHPHGSEEDRRQHDYINYYYEQKEKFVKRFLNRGSKENKD